MPEQPDVSWVQHLLALRQSDHEFLEERDRRYSEVNVEKEKALKIKETADLTALQLAREIQTYKDEKANELREQINSERGRYATKEDLAGAMDKMSAQLAPVIAYMTSGQGRSQGIGESIAVIVGAITASSAIATILALIFS